MSLDKIKLKGPALIAIAATLWALDGIIRRSLFGLAPLIIVFYEHLIGSAIFIPHLIRNKQSIVLSRKDTILLLIVSLVSSVLGTLWFTTALVEVQFIPFSVVFLLQKLQPIFATGTAAILLKEKVTKGYALWAVLALVSGYYVTFPGGIVNLSTGAGTALAALYAVGAAAAWGSCTAFSKALLKNNSATTITGLRFVYATVFSLILIIVFGLTEKLSSPDVSHIMRLFVIVFSTGMVALWIYYKGLKHTQAKVSTIVELIFPMLAVFIDIVLYKSVLAPSQYIAASALLYCIYRVSKLNKKK